MDVFEFIFDLQIEVVTEVFKTMKCKEFFQFPIFQNANSSSSCGCLTVSKNTESNGSAEIEDTVNSVLPAKSYVKRPANNVIKTQSIPKHVKKGVVVSPVVKSAPVESNFGSQSNLQRNPDNYIETMQSLDSGKRMFSCQFCGFQGPKKDNVKRHVILKHIPEAKEELKCSMCSKEFNLKQHLKAHYMHSHKLSDGLAKAAMNGL